MAFNGYAQSRAWHIKMYKKKKRKVNTEKKATKEKKNPFDFE